MAAGLNIIDGASTNRVITAFLIIDGGSVNRTLTQGRVIDANGVDRVFYDPSGAASFTAVAVPDAMGGFNSGAGTITTPVATVTPTGGTAPYTYSWALVSYSHPTTAPAANSPTAAATAFTQTNVAPSEYYIAAWRCTVTDSATPANLATADVETTFVDIS